MSDIDDGSVGCVVGDRVVGLTEGRQLADERGLGEIPERAVLRYAPCGRHPSLACHRFVRDRAEVIDQELRRLLGAVLASDAGVVVKRLSDPIGVGAVAAGVQLD